MEPRCKYLCREKNKKEKSTKIKVNNSIKNKNSDTIITVI